MNIKKLNEELDKLIINEISDRVEYNTKQAPYIEKDAANMKVKDWYISTYPADNLGEEIDPDVTFNDIYTNLPKVYDLLNVGDSIIRERVFEKIAEIKHVDYDVVYYGWLYNSKINESLNEEYDLVGIDSNAFNIIGYVTKAMKEQGFSNDEIAKYKEEATASNYDHLLSVSMEKIDACNNRLNSNKESNKEKEVTNTNLGPQSGDFYSNFWSRYLLYR